MDGRKERIMDLLKIRHRNVQTKRRHRESKSVIA